MQGGRGVCAKRAYGEGTRCEYVAGAVCMWCVSVSLTVGVWPYRSASVRAAMTTFLQAGRGTRWRRKPVLIYERQLPPRQSQKWRRMFPPPPSPLPSPLLLFLLSPPSSLCRRHAAVLMHSCSHSTMHSLTCSHLYAHTMLTPSCSRHHAHATMPPPCSRHHAHATTPTPPCSRRYTHATLPTPPCSRHPAHATMLTPPCSRHHTHAIMLTPPCS